MLLRRHVVGLRPVSHSFFQQFLCIFDGEGRGLAKNQHLLLSEPLFYNSSPINPDSVILEYARAFGEDKNSIGGTTGSVYSGGQLTPFSGPRMLLNLEPNNCSSRRWEHCPPQAGPVGTRPDGCIASSASLLTLSRPSLWDRGNLDPSHHVTSVHCSRAPIFTPPSKLKPFFLISLTDEWLSQG